MGMKIAGNFEFYCFQLNKSSEDGSLKALIFFQIGMYFHVFSDEDEILWVFSPTKGTTFIPDGKVPPEQ